MSEFIPVLAISQKEFQWFVKTEIDENKILRRWLTKVLLNDGTTYFLCNRVDDIRGMKFKRHVQYGRWIKIPNIWEIKAKIDLEEKINNP